MRIVTVIVCLVLETWLCKSMSVKQPDFEEDVDSAVKDYKHFYGTFEKKSAPIYKCDGGLGGMKWRIPKGIDCSLVLPTEQTRIASITLFWPDITAQKIQSYECYGIERISWGSVGFFGGKQYGSSSKYLPMSAIECWTMIRDRKAPNGAPIKEERGSVFGTYQFKTLELSWCKNTSVTEVNYYYMPLQLSVSNLDEAIMSTSLTQKPCMYNESFCPTNIGSLVWESSEIKVCRMRQGESTSCLYNEVEKRLTCPTVELSLHNLVNVSLCNTTFGYNSQGISFLQNNVGEIDNNLGTPDAVASLISMPKPRTKRGVTFLSKNIQEAQMNAKLNYLYELLVNGTKYAVWNVEIEVCKTNQRALEMVRYLAESGHPTLLPRFIFADPSYRGALSGDVISLWKCIPVFTYKLLRREKCTVQWPVAYVYNNEQKTGYISPLSHLITELPTYGPEPCQQFYFDDGEKVFQLTNDMPIIVNLPILAKPGEDFKTHDLHPAATFDSTSGFDITKYTDIGQAYVLARELQAKQSHLDSIQTAVDKIQEDISIFSVAFTIISNIASFVFSFTGLWIFLGLAGALILILLIVSGPRGIITTIVFTLECWKECVVAFVLFAFNPIVICFKEYKSKNFRTKKGHYTEYDKQLPTAPSLDPENPNEKFWNQHNVVHRRHAF